MSTPIPIQVSAPHSPDPSSSPGDERHPRQSRGLGVAGLSSQRNSSVTRDSSSLLHPDDSSPRFGGSIHSRGMSGFSNESTSSLTRIPSGDSIAVEDATPTDESSPFRFQSKPYTPLTSPRSPAHKSVVSQVMGQRRGHRYKHSSVSHSIFQEPAPRAPLRLPASLPIPTVREGWASMTRDQTARISWCFCHLFVAAYVQWTAQGSLALTALSHLIFYDAIGAFLNASVEVLSNFEVWKRSSIRHPFGLERSEVLVGFAMSILLLFMGFDLLSHNASHALEVSDDTHEQHRAHVHTTPRLSAGTLDVTLLLAIAATLISALTLQNHARMAKSMRLARIPLLPAVLNNPSHLLTLSCSVALLGMPLLSQRAYTALDAALSTAMALAMCALGTALVRTLGGMLLMSYTPPAQPAGSTPPPVSKPANAEAVAGVVAAIETDPNVTRVHEAKFWQVHYGLCLANLDLCVRGGEDAIARLRERVTSLVRTRLGGAYGAGSGTTWEVSIEMVVDRDVGR